MKTYPQTQGNLALANESLGLLQKPKPKRKISKLRLVHNTAKDVRSSMETISQVKQVAAVVGMSLVLCLLWFFIVFTLYQIVRFTL
jgi:hypothetical protein